MVRVDTYNKKTNVRKTAAKSVGNVLEKNIKLFAIITNTLAKGT